MPAEKICPTCGKPITENALMGLCPECLLRAGVGTIDTGQDPAEKPAPFAPPAPEELARYFPELEIMELLGRGGMGAVYKARQKRLERFVALKILPPRVGQVPSFAERFEREARALAQLHHPNIVTLYDSGQVDGLFYFFMELVDGVNLRQLLDAGHVSPREALAIVPQICDALQFAHDRCIIHRDIKPENILLNKEGRVKIADFGVAKIVAREWSETPGSGAPAPASGRTEAGKMIGTPSYMAPEQLSSPLEVDHRADIYALGVVFYQMLTGELPSGKFEPPSRKVQIDVRLDEVVLRALEKKPELRYPQASVMKTQVETIAGTPRETRPAEHKLFPSAGLATFRSLTALRFAQLACGGFLGFLGYVPGWGRFFGLFGLFGFIGIAYLIEFFVRSKTSRSEGGVPKLLAAAVIITAAGFAIWKFGDGPMQRSSWSRQPVSEETETHRAVLAAELKQAKEVAAQQERAYEAGMPTASPLEFQASKDKVEILEAELTGDPVRVAQARLLAARRQFKITSNLYNAGMLPTLDYEKAGGEVAIAEAQVTGDPVQIAQARLSAARRQFEITSNMYKAGALAFSDYQKAKGEVTVAEAQLREVEPKTGTSEAVADGATNTVAVTGTAAYAGDIGVYVTSLGLVTPPGAPSATVSDYKQPHSVPVTFTIPEDDVQTVVAKLDVRQPMKVEAYDRAMKKIGEGFLMGVDNQIDASTGMLTCKGMIATDGGVILLPNMFLNIRLLLETKHGVTLLPVKAIQHGPRGSFVYRIQPDHTVTIRPVAIGTIGIEGETVEIKEGLSPGETVVLDAPAGLREGSHVH